VNYKVDLISLHDRGWQFTCYRFTMSASLHADSLRVYVEL